MKTKLIPRKHIPKGQKGLISPNLTTQQKFDILKQTYHYEDNKPIIPSFDKIDDYRKEFINDMFDAYVLNQNPIGVNYDYLPYNDIEVTGYAPLFLQTWYPIVHPWYGKNDYPSYYNGIKYDYINPDENFKWTGHSEITQRNRQTYTKTMEDPDYNLLLNNCSDETRRVLEAVFNKQLKTFGFTTPGDVRDFALENGGKSIEDKIFDRNKKYGRYIMIPMNKERYERLRKYNDIKNGWNENE